MTREELKQIVWQANLDLVKHGLVFLRGGNVSAIDRKRALLPSNRQAFRMTS